MPLPEAAFFLGGIGRVVPPFDALFQNSFLHGRLRRSAYKRLGNYSGHQGGLDPAVVAVSRPERYVLLYTHHITGTAVKLVLMISHDYMSNNEYTGPIYS